MSSVFCPLTDATAVEHVVHIKLLNKEENNLVVARKNLLQVFRLVKREEDLTSEETTTEGAAQEVGDGDGFIGAGLNIRPSERQIVTKLILVSEHRLFGTITALGAIRAKDYGETGLEYLLVAFELAKASLLCWNQDLNDLDTISLHSFEREEFQSPLLLPDKSVMRIDPLSRVATMSFFGDHLAFLPVTQTDELLLNNPDEEEEEEQGPISNSFVLSVLQLQDDITRLIDFTFVHGYQEPAIALLYASESYAPGLLNHWRRDTSKLVVLTLDIQAKERTAILEIDNLPSDLQSVCAIPNPLGGCLLIGTNELIYIDSARRVVALAVNCHAKSSSNLPMRDYSNLDLLLEGCQAVPLQDGDTLDGILLVLANGHFGLLTLNLDGRTVSSLHLRLVSREFGGDCMTSAVTCSSVLTGKRLFLGCASGDSKLLAWRKKARRREESSQGNAIMQDALLDTTEEGISENRPEDELEDIYGDEDTVKKAFGAEKTAFDLHFFQHDVLLNVGPITGMALGSAYGPEQEDRQNGVGVPGEIALVSGAGRAGRLTISRRHITPEVIGKFESPDWRALWTVKVRNSTTEEDDNINNSLDTYLVATKENETQVFTIENAFVETTDSEFWTTDATVFMGTLFGHTCVVQICADVMRTYDTELKLLELKSTPEDRAIVSSSIIDPYVLLILDDARIALYAGSPMTKELEEISHDWRSHGHIVCATLYAAQSSSVVASLASTPSRKRKRDEEADSRKPTTNLHHFCFTIFADGELRIHELPSMQQVFQANISQLNSHLRNRLVSAETNGTKPELAQRQLVEIMIRDLGQSDLSPYLIVRTDEGETIVYQPYLAADRDVCFSKVVSNARNPEFARDLARDQPDLQDHDSKKSTMVYCDDVGGHACVYINDATYPTWLLKTDQSRPTFHAAGMQNVQSLSGFNTLDAQSGYIFCDRDSLVRICRLPAEFIYTGQWSTRTIPLGRSVHAIAYHAPQQVYAVLTTEEDRFEIPDEEDEDWQPLQDGLEALPMLSHGAVELIDTSTFRIIDRYELAKNEQGLCLKSVSLTIATEYTKKKRPCLAVTTGLLRGEDLAMRGAVYVFDIVEVVPEIEAPDAKYRLKCLCREEVRAAATTLCEVDGYLLSSQGQKVVVRSLEEDERLTPVAFVDLGLATTTAKCLRSMIIFGDVQKGLRFVGFGEEPFKMTNFGRDFEAMDVMDVEFLIDDKNLYFVASDTQGNIRMLQYDPENPTTLAGNRLVRRADIYAGHVISSMMLLPQTEATADGAEVNLDHSLVICASSDGSLSVVIPISERTYRRLDTIQAQLNSTETQTAGLNARAYRLCTTEGLITNAGRGILDGQLLSSFQNLSVNVQAQLAKKSGVGADNVLTDLSQLHHAITLI